MPTLSPGKVIAGKYRLDRALARGGMGSLWIARHLQLDAAVAIKFMDPAYARADEARGRFEREARACGRLKSPHIVQVHDYGIDDEAPYIVMELLEGEDLGARLRRGPLTLDAAALLAHQIGKALRTAHEMGVVHRDLKPANIFLCRDHDDDLVKVVDFGIAKIVGDLQVGDATVTGTVVGSPHYMSPEQVRAFKHIDHRADLWSFGVVLFRAVTGHLPFPGDQVSAVLVAVCTDPIRTPSQVAPALGAAVDSFFARALSRDPEQRFQSAKEMAEAFLALSSSNIPSRYLHYSAPVLSVAAVADPVSSQSRTLPPANNSIAASPRARAQPTLLAAAVMLLLAVAGAVVLLVRSPASGRGSASSTNWSDVATISAAPSATMSTAIPVLPVAEVSVTVPGFSAPAPAEVPDASLPTSGAKPKVAPVKQKSKSKDDTFGF